MIPYYYSHNQQNSNCSVSISHHLAVMRIARLDPVGFEPTTSSVQARRSPSQSYGPMQRWRACSLIVRGYQRTEGFQSYTPTTFCSVRRDFNPYTFRHLVFIETCFEARAAEFAFHHAPIPFFTSAIRISCKRGSLVGQNLVSSAILLSQGETLKYLGRICTGTSMSIAALSAVAMPGVVETPSPDRQSGIIAVIRRHRI